MIKEAIIKLSNNENLTYDEASQVMEEMMTGVATQAQMGAFLTALRIKGETIDEISACAYVMRDKALRIKTDKEVMEIVGTGGDGSGTFNISTTSAFVIAAAGIPVAKHGNRSMSSKSGAADCLENLGVNITITPEQSEKVLYDTGMCFMFAQGYHSSMKYVAPVRKEIGIRNVFNILGPLTNPAHASMQLMGVYSEDLVEPLARVLYKLGVKKGMTVFGEDGMDEATMSAKTKVCEINNGEFKTYEISPEDFSLKRCKKEDLLGGNGAENAQITRDILSGKIKGAKYDTVCLNAGLSLYIAGKAENIKDGIKMAQELIDSGKAYEKLEQFVKATNQF